MSLPRPHPDSVTPALVAQARALMRPQPHRGPFHLYSAAKQLRVDPSALDKALWRELGRRP